MKENSKRESDSFVVTKFETIQLLKKLIAIPTVDPPGNEMEAAIAVKEVLEKEGITSKIYDLGSGRANLVARLNGSGKKPAIVFSAHFDTIAVDESQWTMPPFEGKIKDGRLYGRGATDMKSGLVSMVCAAIELKRNAVALAGDLILAFSAAENSSGMGAAELARCGELDGAGAMLISEPTSLKVFIAEKGALWLKATAKGASGHGAFVINWKTDYGNAIVRMSKFIARMQHLDLDVPSHPHLGGPTVNVGKIYGGVSAPIIPSSCTLEIDVRMIPGMTPEYVSKKLQDLAGEHIDIEVIDFKPPVVTAEEDPFIQLCVETCESVLERVPEVTGVQYYSDATTFSPVLKIPMVIIGPGEVGHSGIADEYVEIDNVIKTNRIFYKIARRYLADHND
ncbi:MAG: M20 family metallopeptidase [Deltaproteobacteria bacterium]|nr:M20 family metallopeptidase [Deltaproteobacteria bacterium]